MKKTMVSLLLLIAAAAFADDKLLLRPAGTGVVDPEDAFRVDLVAFEADTLGVRFLIADCCYLYRGKIRFSVSAPDGTPLAGGPRLGSVDLPSGVVTTDEFFGRTEIYRGRVNVRLPLRGVAAGQAFALNVTYQGCSEKDVAICYEPITRRFPVNSDGAQQLVIGSPRIVPR